MNNFETANSVFNTIYSLSGLCFDSNDYEYLTAIIAVCEAIGAKYPKEWVINYCAGSGDENRFDLTEKDKELLNAYHKAWRDGCPIANDCQASVWAYHKRPDLYLRCIGEEVVDG